MKKIFIYAILTLCLSSCCDNWYPILFYNDSDKTIVICTTFNETDSLLLKPRLRVAPHEKEVWLEGKGEDFLEKMYTSLDIDTLCVDVKDVSNDSVLQRYFLSLPDIEYVWKKNLCRLTFPPNPELRIINMWPPYGTYDVHGNRVE